MTYSKLINNAFILLTILAFLAQLFIDFSTVNIATSSIILCSTLSTMFYIRWSSAIETHPLSTIAIFGFCISSLGSALWIQSFSWLAVSYNLRQPLVTFSMLAIYLGIAIIAHMLYRIMNKKSVDKKPGLLIRALDSLEIYAQPSPSVLWGLGLIGLFALLLHMVSPVANGLTFLAWAPVLIFVNKDRYEKDYFIAKIHYLAFSLHLTIITLFAMFFNTRRMLLEGIATLLLIYFIKAMRSEKIFNPAFFYRIATTLLILTTLSYPLTDLATAMVIARAERGKVSPIVSVQNTIENFTDKAKLARYRALAKLKGASSSYEENYINNPLFARLCVSKFHDNAIYFGGRVSDKDRVYLQEKTIGFFWKVLPQPFLDTLKIDIDKLDYEYSMGDLLAQMAVGIPLGAWRTGSVFGHGLAIFGHSFLLVYFALCFILFTAIDIFSKRDANGNAVISTIGWLSIWQTFLFGITADSIGYLVNGMLRNPIQLIILYILCTKSLEFITKVISSKTLLNKYRSDFKL